jgi:hypothetical protein
MARLGLLWCVMCLVCMHVVHGEVLETPQVPPHALIHVIMNECDETMSLFYIAPDLGNSYHAPLTPTNVRSHPH